MLEEHLNERADHDAEEVDLQRGLVAHLVLLIYSLAILLPPPQLMQQVEENVGLGLQQDPGVLQFVRSSVLDGSSCCLSDPIATQ